jgi:YVTN family beta-propeller protein
VLASVPVGYPLGVAVNDQTNRIYVSQVAGAVSVIDGATNQVVATIPMGGVGTGIAVAVRCSDLRLARI